MSKQIGITLDHRKLKKLLTLNLYNYPETCIREIASNALDSKRRAGSEKPIYISYNVNTRIFSCKDYGLGMSVEDFEKKVCILGESDKEWDKKSTDDIEIGKYGIGSLAFRKMYDGTGEMCKCTWVCVKNGKKTKGYIWEEDEELDYEIDDEEDTNEPNSVEVIMLIPHVHKYEMKDWLRQELSYFPDIFWNINGSVEWNTCGVFEGEWMKISDLSVRKQMHICLDDVVYDIDWKKLGMNAIEANIALKFKISDGIEPSITRESLSYTEEFKGRLIEKLKLMSTWIVEKYNKLFKKERDVIEIFRNWNALRHIKINNKEYPLSIFELYSEVKSVGYFIDGVDWDVLNKCINNKGYLFYGYTCEGKVNSNTFTTKTYISNVTSHILGESTLIVLENNEKVSRIKLEYIKSLYQECYFVKKPAKGKGLPLGKKNSNWYSFHYLLELHNVPRSLWRSRIEQVRRVESKLIAKTIAYKDIEPTKEWLNTRKKPQLSRAQMKTKEQITIKIATPMERVVSAFNCKFEPEIVNVSELHKMKKLFIYAKEDDRQKLDDIFCSFLRGKHLTSTKRKTTLDACIISEREQKHVKQLHNFITPEEFMEGKNQPFRRYCTSHLIGELIKKHEKVFQYLDFVVKLDRSFAEKLSKLKVCNETIATNYINKELMTDMISIYHELKWYTEEYYLLQEVQKTINTFDFIPFLEKKKEITESYQKKWVDYMPEEAIDLAREILLNRKRRYDIPLKLTESPVAVN